MFMKYIYNKNENNIIECVNIWHIPNLYDDINMLYTGFCEVNELDVTN